MEIERKFLIEKIPFSLEGIVYKDMAQSYISFSPAIRIRKSDEAYILTVKGRGHMVREEFELAIAEQDYVALRKKTSGTEVRKRRYYIPLENNLTAELDVYEGMLDGLYTVEVEFSSMEEAERFSVPAWFGRDVTTQKRYKNTMLSLYGMPEKE